MTTEELMCEIIESLKSFTIVVAVMLVGLYLIIVGLAVSALVNEKKGQKKHPTDEQSVGDKGNHTTQ